MQRLQSTSHGPQPGPEGIAHTRELVLDHGLAPLDDPSQDPDPVCHQPTLRRGVDRRLDHRPIDAQLPSRGDLRLSSQHDHPIVQGVESLGTDRLSPNAAVD